MLRHFLNPPNWFSSASLFCGLYAICLAMGVGGEADLYRAGAMILFAGVFDSVDGRVARMTGTGTRFGVELDSLVDLVSFGVAPSLLVYAWALHDLGPAGLGASFFFVLAAAFRLARFNVETEQVPLGWMTGLATTVAGPVAAAMVMVHSWSGRIEVQHPGWVLGWFTALALLMVSDVPYRTLKALRLSRLTLLGMAVLAGTVVTISLQTDISAAFVAVLGPYAISGPLEALAWGRRELEAVPDDDDLVEAPVHSRDNSER